MDDKKIVPAKGANIAYIRVSTVEQNTARQLECFNKAGIRIDKIFEEKISGKDRNRPQLTAMLDYVREGDTVYIESYSRLARNTRDLLNLIHELEERDIHVVSLKENYDTSSPNGRLMLSIMQCIAEFERDIILERQREGIAIAKAKGKFQKPEKKIPQNFPELYELYRTRQRTASSIAKELSISRSLLYKWFRKMEDNQITG